MNHTLAFAHLALAGCFTLLQPASFVHAQTESASVAASSQTPATESKSIDNVVVVLDASGSMREKIRGTNQTRMEMAKSAIIRVLEQVSPTTNVGILVFSGGRKAAGDWVVPLGPVRIDAIRAALSPIQPDGGTPLGEYMRQGADRLLQQRQLQLGYGSFRLLVVTDGEESAPQMVDRFLPEVLSRGINVNVIGLDMKSGHSLATKVNSYKSAQNASELVSAMKAVFAEVGASSQDALDTEQFEMIASLNTEAATGILAALRPESNDPIGTPKPQSLPSDATSTQATSTSTASQPVPSQSGQSQSGQSQSAPIQVPPTTSSNSPASSTQGSSSSGISGTLTFIASSCFVVFLFGVVLVVIARKLIMGGKS